MAKAHRITKLQVFSTLLLSLINTVLATLFISIYWPAGAIERMAVAALLVPVIWISLLLVGFLSPGMKKALSWQTVILFAFSGIVGSHFL